jgi:hypothetical protein
MTKESKMEQKSGKDSTNIQIKEFNAGLSYKDVKELCLDLITDKLDSYKEEASIEAKKREEKLRTDFIDELEKNKIDLNEFKNPSMQLCYIDAQKGYISYGDDTSEKILLELLKDRISESDKSILQISLNEAVKVAPLLMKKHLNTLSLLFFIKEMSIMGIRTRAELIDFIKDVVLKFTKDSSLTKVDYEHLEYNKCITKIEIFKSDIFEIMRSKYKYYFLKEISYDDFQQKYSQLTKYIGSLAFFNVDSDNMLRFKEVDSFLSYNELDIISSDDREMFNKMLKDLTMSDEEFERTILDNNDLLCPLFYTWKEDLMSSCSLTTIGKVLAMINIKIELKIPVDMSIWI